MTTREAIDMMLERIRPALQADGGDIELVALEGDIVRIRLTGACVGCPSASVTLQAGVEAALRRVRPQLRVVPVS